MSIDSVLSEHKAWLDKAAKVLASNQPPAADLAAPIAVKQQLIQTLASRIDELTGQKEAAIKHYDTAIADAKTQQAKLQQELAANKTLLQPVTGTVRQPAGVAAPAKAERARKKRKKAK